MTDDIMPNRSQSGEENASEDQNTSVRVRLGPRAKGLLERSNIPNASPQMKPELAIEEQEARNAELTKQLAQASSNTPVASATDLAFFIEEFAKLQRAVERAYEDREAKHIEVLRLIYGVSEQLNECIINLKALRQPNIH